MKGSPRGGYWENVGLPAPTMPRMTRTALDTFKAERRRDIRPTGHQADVLVHEVEALWAWQDGVVAAFRVMVDEQAPLAERAASAYLLETLLDNL